MRTQQSELPRAGGPETPVRPPSDPSRRVARRRLYDRVTSGIVRLGGLTVIASILAILFVIAVEMLPLFGSPKATPAPSRTLESVEAPLAVGTDEYREIAWAITAAGPVFRSIKDGRSLPVAVDLKAEGATVTSVSPIQLGTLALGLSDGRALRARILFTTSYTSEGRKIDATFKADPPLVVDSSGRPLRRIAEAQTEKGALLAATVGTKEVLLLALRQKKTLMGDGKIEEVRQTVPLKLDGEISALAADSRGDDLFVGTSDGQLLRIDLREEPRETLALAAASTPGAAIRALGFINGDRMLVVGDAAGGVATWQMLRSEEGNYYLARVARFERHEAAISAFSPSIRDKGFVTADAKGVLHLKYSTTGETLARLEAGPGVTTVALTPKSNGIVALNGEGKLLRWDLRNPHPQITMRALFGSVWYEGYSEPDYVWQSTGGTDDFEAKFGLTPLIYGTLKGTFYALLIAVPLALLSALYVSQFMHPSLKANVKPLIEVMAALPSVVLGFIAALWLAPRVERFVPGLLLMPLVQAALILGAVSAWRLLPLAIRQRFKHGTEVALILPIVLLGAGLAFWLGGGLEAGLLGGDYQAWLLKTLGLQFDQRNSVVVGLAMGFAVIPIIFTIAEDSLSNVPPYLAAGSLALGATRWQTALKVVLPTASPGIFSAVMIGFGRAVGETMIVLMATGNTPVMNWSPFKGFRALSANVAVELPEAAEGETLYRVLFLAAFLLFLMTFAVNTAAEVVRLRLRKRFQSL